MGVDYYVDGPISPAAEPATAEGDIHPKPEADQWEAADPNYRAGALTAEEADRQAAGGDTFTTTEYFEDSTVAELKDELEDRGLAKSGNKPDLIERLAEDDKSE